MSGLLAQGGATNAYLGVGLVALALLALAVAIALRDSRRHPQEIEVIRLFSPREQR